MVVADGAGRRDGGLHERMCTRCETGGAVAYVLASKPGDVRNSHAEFTPEKPAPPKPAVDTFSWPILGYSLDRRRYFPTATVKPPYRTRWKVTGRVLLEFPPVMAEGKLYHFAWGYTDRMEAKMPPSHEQIRAHVPEKIQFLGFGPRRQDLMTLQYLPPAQYRGTNDQLPGFDLYIYAEPLPPGGW